MAMSKEEKEARKDVLRMTIKEKKLQSFDHWIHLFEMDDTMRRHCGYSKGADDMVKKLAKQWRDEERKLMAPFDRGDYD